MPKIKALVAAPILYLGVISLISGLLHLLFVTSLEVPTSGEHPGYDYPQSKRLMSYEDSRLNPKSNESDLEFATRASNEVFMSAWHCNTHDPKLSVANPLLFKIVRFFLPTFDKSIKSNGVVVLDHGFYFCGLCHQQAVILADVLNKNNIRAWPWGVSGHVVLKAQINDKVYFFDPNFGVGPIVQSDSKDSIDQIEKLYLSVGAEKTVSRNNAVRIFKKENHAPYKGPKPEYWDKVISEPQKKGLFWVKVLQKAPLYIFLFSTSLLFLVFLKLRRIRVEV